MNAPARPAPVTPVAADAAALLRLALPILISQLAVMGLAVIDTVMTGQLSPVDLAGVALGGAINASVFIGLIGVLQSLAPIAGHHYGAGREQEIGIDLGQALWLAAGMTLFGWPWLIFSDVWLQLAGAEPAVAHVARDYLRAAAVSLPALLALRTFTALFAALSRPKIAMIVNLGVLAGKVPFNMLFIRGAGPIPPLAGAGCGAATATLMWLALLAIFLAWHFDPFYRRFRAPPSHPHRPIWSRQKELLKLGLPAGGTVLIEVTSFTLIAVLIARLGAVTVAGHQIVANLVSVLFMVPLALGIATTVLVAQCLGAGQSVTARRAALRGVRVTMSLAVAAASALYLLRAPIVAAYTSSPAVVDFALSLLGVAAVFHLCDALQGVTGSILRGYKIALAPMLVHSVALWGVGLGGGWWLAYHAPSWWHHEGAYSFWVAATVGLAIAATALTVLAALTAWRHAGARTRI